MKEVNKPKRMLRNFYLVALAVLLMLNMVIMPMIMNAQVKETDYGTFMTMTNEGNIGLVQIVETENYIMFTDKAEKQVYKTGIVNDPGLTERLHAAGANFSGEIIEQPGIFSQIIFNWVLPIAMFVIIGQLISKHMMKKMGGQNSMMFNMGKSNAKVYVKSDNGIKFRTLRERTRQRKTLLRSWTICIIRRNMKRSAQRCPKDSFL